MRYGTAGVECSHQLTLYNLNGSTGFLRIETPRGNLFVDFNDVYTYMHILCSCSDVRSFGSFAATVCEYLDEQSSCSKTTSGSVYCLNSFFLQE